MVTTKENCYQGVDRTVLIELKKIYNELQKRMPEEGQGTLERNTYIRLREIFSNSIYRPFFQGDDEYTAMNAADNFFFIETIRLVSEYIKSIACSLDVDLNNLKFRLDRIIDGDCQIEEEHLENEFADGTVIISNMSEEEFLKAVKEFSEGSEALEQFLVYCYKNKIYTKACCTGHLCKNNSLSETYIAFDLDDDHRKQYLMSKAFENDIGLAIIKFKTGLGFDLLINPYDIEEKVAFLQKCLEQHRGDEEINPIVTEMLKYCSKQEANNFFSLMFGESRNKKVFFEERTSGGVTRGWCEQNEMIYFYRESNGMGVVDAEMEVLEPQTNSNDVARSILNLTKTIPGKFAESMKRTLGVVQKIFKDKGVSR